MRHDLVDLAIQDAGVAVNVAGEGVVFDRLILEVREDRVKENGAHQDIEAGFDSQLRAGQAFLLRKADHFQEGGLAGLFHFTHKLLHFGDRQADILKAPMGHRGVLAFLEQFQCVLYGLIVVGQHEDK